MATGKALLLLIATQLSANGWWFVATQQESLDETAMILIPVMSTGVVILFIIDTIIDNWE